MITDSELLQYNQEGFIPGPCEEEADFLQRVNYCKQLKQDFTKIIGSQIPLELTELPQDVSTAVNKSTKQQFDIVLDWTPIVFNNYRMLPWHGGCAWIFQLNENTPYAAFFQLRQEFLKSEKYLNYRRIELIAHESAHAARMLFKEPKFEEILAYQSSPSTFRKFFGPIVQSSWESLLFIFVLFITLVLDIYFSFSGYGSSATTLWLKGLAVCLVFAGVIRACWRQRQFRACVFNLQKTLVDPCKAKAVAFRLQDSEIIAFGKKSPSEIQKYAEEQRKRSLRWRAIYFSYFI